MLYEWPTWFWFVWIPLIIAWIVVWVEQYWPAMIGIPILMLLPVQLAVWPPNPLETIMLTAVLFGISFVIAMMIATGVQMVLDILTRNT